MSQKRPDTVAYQSTHQRRKTPAVECVTNREGEGYEKFIERAGKKPIARQVKIADLEAKMNILRIGEIKPKDLERLEKYHKSWCLLTKNGNI